MELAANDRLIVKNILVQQVGFLGDASERAKDNTELLTLTAEMLDALKMIVLFDGSQEKDGRVRRSEEDDCTKKPALISTDIVDRGNWSAQIVPGGKVTIPPGRHAGDGSVSAAALKTMALRVSDWPHEYPGMEWHYTLTGGTLVGVAGLGRASGDASSNVIESIRIAGNTIYVKNASGGYPMRDITLLYY